MSKNCTSDSMSPLRVWAQVICSALLLLASPCALRAEQASGGGSKPPVDHQNMSPEQLTRRLQALLPLLNRTSERLEDFTNDELKKMYPNGELQKLFQDAYQTARNLYQKDPSAKGTEDYQAAREKIVALGSRLKQMAPAQPPPAPAPKPAPAPAGGGSWGGLWYCWMGIRGAPRPAIFEVNLRSNGDYYDFKNPLAGEGNQECKASIPAGETSLYFYQVTDGNVEGTPFALASYDSAHRWFQFLNVKDNEGKITQQSTLPVAGGHVYALDVDCGPMFMERPTIEGHWMRSDGNDFVFSRIDATHYSGKLGNILTQDARDYKFTAGQEVVTLERKDMTTFSGTIRWQHVDRKGHPDAKVDKVEQRPITLTITDYYHLQSSGSEGFTFELYEERHK